MLGILSEKKQSEDQETFSEPQCHKADTQLPLAVPVYEICAMPCIL